MIRARIKEGEIFEYSNNRNRLMSKTRAFLVQLGNHQFGIPWNMVSLKAKQWDFLDLTP